MRRFLPLVALALLALAGCSDDSAQEAAADGERLADLDRALWERTEDLTVECMRDSGFDYSPRPYPGRDRLRFAGSPFELTAEEAAEQGFGITDSVLASAAEMAPDDDENVNEAIQDALPESEQGPWALALQGSPDSSTPGCRRQAQAEADAEHAEEIADLVTRRADAGQRMEADPRHDEMWERWSDCMAERGIEARDIDDLHQTLRQEAQGLVTLPVPDDPSDVEDGTFEPEVRIDVEGASALREREISAATASVACLEPLEDTYLSIMEDALPSHD